MNILKNISYKVLFLNLILAGLLISCSKKSEQGNFTGETVVKFKIALQETIEENTKKKASLKQEENPIQRGVIKLSDDLNVEYELTPQTNTNLKQNISAGLANSPKLMATSVERTPLENGTKYRVLAYDSSGDLRGDQLFTYGSETSGGEMKLDAGETYTFIALSINSVTAVPDVQEEQSLSTIKVVNITEELLLFKETKKLTFGVNHLSIILKHQFGNITTNLTIDSSTIGSFTSLGSLFYKPTYSSADVDLNTGTVTYNGENTTGTSVGLEPFSVGAREIKGIPTSIIHPAVTNGTLTFKDLIIDEDKKSFDIAGFTINPGVKYVLNLNLKTCTEDVSAPGLLNWNYKAVTQGGPGIRDENGVFIKNGNAITRTIIAPPADYGFVFDIYQFDNAFNMEVNGVQLAIKEIQFQRYNKDPVGGIHQNIRFKDGSYYDGKNVEGGNIRPIYDASMVGNSDSPLLRVIIDKNGQVKIYGSKVPKGPLYELELIPELNAFNTFHWNPNENNTVKITMIVDGQTILIGSGSGKKKISCN